VKPLLNFIRAGNLRHRLLGSHLQIALIGVLMIGVALVSIISLRDAAQRAASERAPTMQASTLTLNGLHRSLAEMRGWVALGDERFREGRHNAWQEEIRPALERMQRLSQNWADPRNKQQLAQVSKLLAELEELQWWIEDVAQAPGNEPARLTLTRDVEPVAERVLTATTAMIDEEMVNGLGAEHKQLLGMMVDFRAAFLHSTVMLSDFVSAAETHYQQAYYADLDRATERLNSINDRHHLLSAQQQRLILWIQQRFVDYRHFAEQALAQRQSETWNVARHLLASQALPVAEQAIRLLQTMSASQQRLMAEEAAEVSLLGSIAVWLSLALIGVMMITAGWLSRRSANQIAQPIAALSQATQALAEGRLTVDIPVTGDDELSQLTAAFNRMRSSLQQGEAALQSKAQHLERSNRELDQFAYVASHDLKAPLRAIANLSRWIEEDLEECLTAGTRKQMGLLRGRVHRMEGLIEGVLQYSRVGRVALDVEQVDVGRLLSEIVDDLAPPGCFSVEIAPDMPRLNASQVRLYQVFANLIGNAIKYRERDDGRVEVSVEERDAFYRFSIADDGSGIDEAFHGKVFQIFQTLQARDTVESTGIGLTLVKKIVEEEGGNITLKSTPGQGATFLFTWPKQPPLQEQ